MRDTIPLLTPSKEVSRGKLTESQALGFIRVLCVIQIDWLSSDMSAVAFPWSPGKLAESEASLTGLAV